MIKDYILNINHIEVVVLFSSHKLKKKTCISNIYYKHPSQLLILYVRPFQSGRTVEVLNKSSDIEL